MFGKSKCGVKEKELERFLDGEVSGERKTYLEGHVSECPECSAKLGRLKSLRNLVSEALRADIPEAELEKVTRNVEEHIAKPMGIAEWFRLHFDYSHLRYTYLKPALAALLIIALIVSPIFMRLLAPTSNEAMINSVETELASVSVYKTPEKNITVIWVSEDQRLKL